jgi:hypothetical protein
MGPASLRNVSFERLTDVLHSGLRLASAAKTRAPMLAACSRIVALTAIVAALSTTASADEILTLACQGIVRIDDWSLKRAGQPQDAKPEPYSTGMTVDLTGRTVQGFGMEYPIKITNINAGTIIFSDSDKQGHLFGQIDRVTGDMEATITYWSDREKGELSNQQFYSLKCKPTQRMF